jgi:hypothetical protein
VPLACILWTDAHDSGLAEPDLPGLENLEGLKNAPTPSWFPKPGRHDVATIGAPITPIFSFSRNIASEGKFHYI